MHLYMHTFAFLLLQHTVGDILRTNTTNLAS